MPSAEDSTCGSLLRELESIWDEVGEPEEERDRMLWQLEQECLDVYRRKVDQANCSRARLHQALADSEAELAALLSSLGDRPCSADKPSGTLREQLCSITPQLEALRLRKDERVRQMQEVKLQIAKLSSEISGASVEAEAMSVDDDLSLRKLNEYEDQLRSLQVEQNNRLQKVLGHVSTLRELCLFLNKDFGMTVRDLHPSLDDPSCQKSVSDETLAKLAKAIEELVEERDQRLQKLQALAASLIEHWKLMDVPFEERHPFKAVTRSLEVSEHTNLLREPGSLSLEVIEKAEDEVRRLGHLKISKMKELVLKRRAELQDICKQAHMACDPSLAEEKVTILLESALIDPSELLDSIEQNITKATEEWSSRKEIMDKMDKWIAACEEESWLEDYSKDESRYNAYRGAHLNLKRAERARVVVAKLPVLLESLTSKTKAWEEERGRQFMYDEVPLLAMLDEYNLLRKEKEEEKRRSREQKKLQEQFLTEQETLYGSTKARKARPPGNCRLSLEPSMHRAQHHPQQQQQQHQHQHQHQQQRSSSRDAKKRLPSGLPLPSNYVALLKDDASSVASSESAPNSPVAV